jgi:superfamily II DNA or RNA helicase
MKITLRPDNPTDYAMFLKVKALPIYSVRRKTVEFPDEYAGRLGLPAPEVAPGTYTPLPCLFDYQRDISRLAIRKRKFAVFLDPGYGKTLIFWEYARHVAELLPAGKCVLVVSPLMVVRQSMEEYERFYGDDVPVLQVRAKYLNAFLSDPKGGKIGITNYEAITDKIKPGRLGCLILDESSMLKSHYGRWGKRLIEMGKGLDWKLCLTGTPAPNDRIEYANHAVLLDEFPTINSFLSRFFVNRGQTQERWELKPHALRPFYLALSHWCIFVSNPGVYGWKDNATSIPPIKVHIHDVPLTQEQVQMAMLAGGDMYGTPGGITSRATLARLAKGYTNNGKVASKKPDFIRSLVASWPDESSIIWCKYNDEQDGLENTFPDAVSIQGKTPYEARERLIADFKSGRKIIMISKPDVLGFGLNLQVATRHVFSTCQDSYEDFIQALKRSNRVGSTRELNAHIPVTELERPMVDTVLRKAKMVQHDCDEQARLFRETCYDFGT